MRKKKELKLTHRCRLLFSICERGRAAMGPYSLCGLRSMAAKAAVQNSYLWKNGCEGNLAFQEKKGGTQAYSPSPASVLYLQEGAGGGMSLFPLWTEIDAFQSHRPK